MTSNSSTLYPLLFEPVLKNYIWGGRNLEQLLGRTLPPGKVAESWEIAAHEDGASIVTNGIHAGLSLTELNARLGLDLVGHNNAWAMDRGKFPLLVKLLDAHDKLSVQVHPDDTYALAHEGNELGKTEMWVILHAQPGAEIILGLKQGTTPAILRQAIEESTVERFLHRLAVKAGDFVCVPSGTIHAILGGILIAEIQQNSNTTYRVYDWNRTKNGKARSLHIESALEVINFDRVEPELTPPLPVGGSEQVIRYMLCDNHYFTTERIIIAPGAAFTGEQNGDSLEIWGVLDGVINVNEYRLEAVRFTLLPASMGAYRIASSNGATCLRTYVSGSL